MAEKIKEVEPNSANFFLRIIQNHYTVEYSPKSEEQIEREKWLVPNYIRFNRWYLMPPSVIIQFFCGSLYAWSVFNKPIDIFIYGENKNIAPITFYITVAFFGLSACFMGPNVSRLGPFRSAMLGASLFFLGNMTTALALYLKQMWLIFVGYGIFGGTGLAISYMSPISALQQWFYDKRGLASGFAVCGSGAGSIVIGKLILPSIKVFDLPMTFVVLGSCYFACMCLSALVLRTPPPNYTLANNNNSVLSDEKKPNQSQSQPEEKAVDYAVQIPKTEREFTLIESLSSSTFRFMYIMFLSNGIFGVIVASRLSNMVTDIFGKTPEEAATIVSINGCFNLAGRLLLSTGSDYLGRKYCFGFMLTAQLIIVALFSTITTSHIYWAFLMSMWILTASYGAGFGVIPAFLTDQFGAQNVGPLHGVILTAWALSGVCGGLIFTIIFNAVISSGVSYQDPYPYNINSWWSFGIILIGWVALFFIRPTEKDKKMTKTIRSFFSCCGCSDNEKKYQFTVTYQL